MLTSIRAGGDHGCVSSLIRVSQAGRALERNGDAAAAALHLPRRIGFTRRRVIDLMRVGRSSCCQ
jgi:hypothetical protein